MLEFCYKPTEVLLYGREERIMSIQDLQDFANQLNSLVEANKFLLFLLMNMSSEEIEEYKKRYQAKRKEE